MGRGDSDGMAGMGTQAFTEEEEFRSSRRGLSWGWRVELWAQPGGSLQFCRDRHLLPSSSAKLKATNYL